MHALVFDGQLKLVSDYPLPPVPAGESLVCVQRAGICNTDLEIVKGYMGFRGVLGHEFVGVIAEGERQGTRVVGEINASCAECSTCRRGDETHCPNRTTLGILNREGAFAEFLTLPTRNLHPVPDGVGDAQAVFVEPLAAACEITERLHVKPTDRVAVIGDGKLGLLAAQVLALTGCDLLAIGRHPEKLALLDRRGIATATEGKKIPGQFDMVVDCAGQPSGFDLARRLTRPRGTLVLKSTFHGAQAVSLAPLVVDEVSVIGSRCGPFAPALRLLEHKQVDVDSLLEGEYPIARGLEAFKKAAAPGALKVQIIF